MRSSQATLAIYRQSDDPLRACVHDLRNLFAVVASAKLLLERTPDEQRERLILDALGRVAIEGKIVTDALLAGGEERSSGSHAAEELMSLSAIIKTLERPGLEITLSIDEGANWILIAPSEFRAVVLELVTNAVRAGARKIQVCAARRGSRCWLTVADDGAGFPKQPSDVSSAHPAGLHGTGMRRISAAIRSARGKLRIRSRAGSGSVVAIILPLIRIVAAPPAEQYQLCKAER